MAGVIRTQKLILLYLNNHRAVVGAHYFRQNGGRLQVWEKFFGHKPVVDAPTDIALAGVGPMRPPSIKTVSFFIKYSKTINKSGFYYLVDALALFFCKSVLALVGLWVSQVLLLMRHI